MRLTTHSHGQGEVLHPVSDVSISQKFLAELDLTNPQVITISKLQTTNLLQEKSLYSLLV